MKNIFYIILCLLLYSPCLLADKYKCHNDNLDQEKIISPAKLALVQVNLEEGYGVFEIYNPHQFYIVLPTKSFDGKKLWYDPLFKNLMGIDLSNIQNGWLMILRNYVEGYEKELEDRGDDVNLIIKTGEKKQFYTRLPTHEEFNWADINKYAFRLTLDRVGEGYLKYDAFFMTRPIGIVFSDPFCFNQ